MDSGGWLSIRVELRSGQGLVLEHPPGRVITRVFFEEVEGSIAPQHYAFLVSAEEFDDVVGRLSVAGHEIWADPATSVAGVAIDQIGNSTLYFRDLDRHLLEVTTKPDPSASASTDGSRDRTQHPERDLLTSPSRDPASLQRRPPLDRTAARDMGTTPMIGNLLRAGRRRRLSAQIGAATRQRRHLGPVAHTDSRVDHGIHHVTAPQQTRASHDSFISSTVPPKTKDTNRA